MGDSRERSRAPPSGQHHRSSTASGGGGSKKQQGGAPSSRACAKAVSPGVRSLGGEGKRKQRASAANASNALPVNRPQLASSFISRPSSLQCPPTQAVAAVAQRPQSQQQRQNIGQPSAIPANFTNSNATPSSGNTAILPKASWPPAQFFAGQQRPMQQPTQQLSAFDVGAAFQRSVVIVPGLPRLSHAVSRAISTRPPAANAPAAVPTARAPTFPYSAALGPRFIAPGKPVSSASLGNVGAGIGSPLQQFLMQERPLLMASGSSRDGSLSSSCRDTPAPYYPAPVFSQAATHAESADNTSSLLPSASSLSRASDLKAPISTVESAVVPSACCGYPLHAMDVSQLFSGSLSCQLRPVALPLPVREADCRSSIQLLEDAEVQATAFVVSAQERARDLRAKAKQEIDEEERRLRESMEASLETIAQKYKNECEQQKELQRRKEAHVNVILARDKKTNLQGVVAMVIDFVLKVDLECPIEAIKRFGHADQLLAFKEKSLVQHHPSGELLLRTEDYMVWDDEGRAYLQRDAQRQRNSRGSFWTKHQSKVHASERPAVLLKPPSFIDPLDSDINRRMPSLWDPQSSFEYQPFKLPAFAASSSSSEASPREHLSHESPIPPVALKIAGSGMQSTSFNNTPAKQMQTQGSPSGRKAKQ
ncbi:hypothetical protein Esti_002684 [Eimeria stiedai]